MHNKKISCVIAVAWLCFFTPSVSFCLAQLFKGRINANGINIRADSNTTSEIICKADRGERVEVLAELYDWYKIRVPYYVPEFIKKEFVVLLDDKTGQVLRDNVNIRMRPDTSAPILGKVDARTALVILGTWGDWYKISALAETFGWVHKRFVDKIEEQAAQNKQGAE